MNRNPNLDADWQVGSMTFATGAGAFTIGSTTGKTLSIDSGGITNDSANTQTITSKLRETSSQIWNAKNGALVISGTIDLGSNRLTIAGDSNTTLGGVISGGSSGYTLTKTGAGALTLSGNNSFAHVLALNAGTVVLTNSNALGASTANNTIASGAALHLQNNITVTEGSFIVAGTGPDGNGAIVNDSGNNTLSAQLTLTGSTKINSANAAGSLTLGSSGEIGLSTYDLELTGPGATMINSSISGAGVLSKTGSGATTFSQEVNTNGAVVVGGSGAVVFQQTVGNTSSLTVGNSATTTFNGAVNARGDIVINGTGATAFKQTVGAISDGGLSISGSGPTTFDSTVSINNTANIGGSGTVVFGGALSSKNNSINVTNSATTTFNGNINAGNAVLTVSGLGNTYFNGSQINANGMTINGSGNATVASSLNLSGGNLEVKGSGNAVFTGTQVNVSAINVSGSGINDFNTQINATSFNQTGSGQTMLGGTGNNNIGTVNVSGGTVVFDKSSGFAASGSINVTDGGTLAMGGNSQMAAWTNMTLGEGSVLNLGNTTQSIGQLHITGDTVIDFAAGGSVLNVNNLTIDSGATLSVINWSAAVDTFAAQTNPGSSSLGTISFNGGTGSAWNNYGGVITPTTPVPEPSTYGLILTSVGMAVVAGRKWIRRLRATAKDRMSDRLPASHL